ncbi:MAG: hypothetical protein AB8B52_02035 [Winogradskyella sp.]|uniref:hypothetical protein n=1 Tax=Winogradskyella sp. TaxID=1883156 RepID=UPI00385F1DF4
MKTILLLPFLFLSIILNAQIDYEKQNNLLLSAYRAKANKDYQAALDLYNKAYKIKKLNSISEYLSAAICAAETKNNISCENWLKAVITEENATSKTILNFSKNENYQKSANNILVNHEALSDLFFAKKKNLTAYVKIQKLVNRDQFTRKLSDYHLGISKKDQEEAFDGYLAAQKANDTVALKKHKNILWPEVSKEHDEYNNKIMRHTDSLNIVELIAITKKHGWQEEAHLLLWHQRGSYGEDNWIWKYFKPLINNEIKAGTAEPSFWAMFEDFKSIRENGETIYGYHPGKVNKDTVNKKRRSIGLPELNATEIEARNNNPFGGRMY